MKINKNKIVILLTGTITPNSFSNLKIVDPKIRRQHYLDSINFYLSKTNFKLIFAENSNAILDDFPMDKDRIEYLSFASQPTNPDRGKAYKEMEIIDFTFQNSKFLKDSKSIVKITGRLKVLNINHLTKRYQRLQEKYPHLIYGYPYRATKMDARCFYFTKDFWPYLKNRGKDLNLFYNFELSLWNAAQDYVKKEGNKYFAINPPPRIKGLSGAFGNKYRHNLLFHYARTLRYLISN